MSLIPPTPTKIVGQRAHEFLIARIISGAEVLAPLKQKIPVAAYIGQIFDKGRLRLSLVGGEVIAQLSAPPPSNLKPGSLVSLRITNGGTAIQIQTSREKNRNEAGARLNVNPIVFDNKHICQWYLEQGRFIFGMQIGLRKKKISFLQEIADEKYKEIMGKEIEL